MARTILLVEDDRVASELLTQILTGRGFGVIQAHTGREGLAKAEAQPPDLMLLDLMLPDIDGFAICETLRTNRHTNLIPTVMITALGAVEQQARGFRVGANCYLVKPYTRQQLFQAIDEALAWKDQLTQGQVEGELTFDVASQTKYLVEVNDLVSALLRTPLEERAVKELCQAVWDIGQDAVERVNRHQLDRIVRITYRLYGDRVTVNIRNEENALPRTDESHTASDADPIAHLITREVLGLRGAATDSLINRGLVDEVECDETGSEVTLTRWFRAGNAAQEGGGQLLQVAE